jgi:hypothetical protein
MCLCYCSEIKLDHFDIIIYLVGLKFLFSSYLNFQLEIYILPLQMFVGKVWQKSF